jgi:aminopeptidase-like protein
MHGTKHAFELIWQAYSGEAAWQAVSDLSRFHRIQASPGFRQAAQWIHQSLGSYGLDAEIFSFPADNSTQSWSWGSFQEWECTEARLHLLASEDRAEDQGHSSQTLLADFRADPISLIQRSTSFDGEAEVVLLKDGIEESDYDGLDVAGKVVLSRGELRRVWELAVKERGAIGILFDGMRPVPHVRPEGDLADVRQYTSFWWQPGDTKCFGFVLTPRQGQTLRRMLKEAETPVRIRSRVASRLYDGALEVVSAAIPGETDEEIIVVAHLCHPQPSANDNASGAAAALETARTLHALIAKGSLTRPKRTIRFLWLAEMTGTIVYLAAREDALDRMIAGINLDMVGEDQNQTGSVWLIERPPDAAASFAPELLARLRDAMPGLEGMTDISPSHTGIGAIPLYRQAEVPFSGGSDHYIFSDPTVGVPTPMLIQWPDRFYHTAADTPDRTDPQSLARAGSLAAAYTYWLATAGANEATWLGHEMVARFKSQLIQTAQAIVAEAASKEDAEAMANEATSSNCGHGMVQAIHTLDQKLAYLLDRQKAALGTLQRLAPVECPVADLQAEVERVANHELAWAKGVVDLRAAATGLDTLPELPPRILSEDEQQAASLVPTRKVRGPIPLSQHLHRLGKEDRDAWQNLLKARKGRAAYTLTILALYWADGTRSVLDIADLVEMETGKRDVKVHLAFFRLLEKLQFVAFV